MWKQRNMKIGGDWHHMLGVFFCFPTGRWEVSGKLAKKVWAYIENLHVYLLFQICNGKKIVNIYWNHYFLKGRKNLLGQKPVLNEKKFLQVFNHLSTETWDYLQWSEVQQCGEKKTKLREKWCTEIGHSAVQWAENSRESQKSQSKLMDGGKPREALGRKLNFSLNQISFNCLISQHTRRRMNQSPATVITGITCMRRTNFQAPRTGINALKKLPDPVKSFGDATDCMGIDPPLVLNGFGLSLSWGFLCLHIYQKVNWCTGYLISLFTKSVPGMREGKSTTGSRDSKGSVSVRRDKWWDLWPDL